jgi:hypothetical protein
VHLALGYEFGQADGVVLFIVGERLERRHQLSLEGFSGGIGGGAGCRGARSR